MAGKKLNMEKFEEYFQRADTNGDGRISGNEAIDFFQGSDLPRKVLAEIWMHVDQNRTGFLGRPEFYNALKLVTVAQSKRELTKDIVKAALHGPVSAKIPAPQINLAAKPSPQSNMKVGSMSVSQPKSSSLLTGSTDGSQVGIVSQVPNRILSHANQEGVASESSLITQPKTPEITSSMGNGTSSLSSRSGKQEFISNSAPENILALDSNFGDMFSPSPSQPRQNPTSLTNSIDATLTSLTDHSTAIQDQRFTSTETKASQLAPAQSQLPWPKMTLSDVQKYSKVFELVDTDRDGKITAEQAGSLFSRLKLPQEVLKLVWDLPDQNNDSMLTLREFCIALYLMEHPFPAAPMFDWSLFPSSGQAAAAYGYKQPQGITNAQALTSVPVKPVEPIQEKAGITVLEKHHVDQLNTVEQDSLNNKFREANNAQKKIWKYADHIQAGFPDRREIGNAQKNATPTPDISKATASAETPPPQINLADTAGSQSNMKVGVSPYEAMRNGEFLNKDPDELSEYFDFDAASEREQFWDMDHVSYRSSRSTTESLVGDKYQIREEDDLNARLATLATKVEAIELWKVNGIASTHMRMVKDGCSICDNMEHSTNSCPMIPVLKEVLHDQANATNTFKRPHQNPSSEASNSSWKNDDAIARHYRGPSTFVPYDSPRKKSLEDMLQQFMQSQTIVNDQTSQAIVDIRSTLTKLTASLSNQRET